MWRAEASEKCFKLSMTDYITYVSVEEADSIFAQLKNGEQLLEFRDLNNSLTYLPLKDFRCMWETSPEIRQICQDWNETLTEEEKQRKNKWSD